MTIWLVFLVPFAGGLIVLAGPHDRRWLGAASAMICIATVVIAATVPTAPEIASFNWGGGPLQLTARFTAISALLAMLVPVVTGIVIVYASAHEHALGLRRLIGLLIAFLAGMELLLIADDFLTLLIGWEAVGACSWALIGHKWQEGEAGRSAIYAFIATRLGDLGLFVAALAVFGGSGTFAFPGIAQLAPMPLGLVAAGVILSAAAKSGQVPFAPWLFRAMAGPTSVSALLHAATMVAAGAYLLIRLQPMLGSVAWFGPVVIGIGLVTALTGGIVALVQPHAKKLLAASTSAHYGLMFIAAGAGFPVVAALHLVAHALFKSLLFLVAGIAGERAGNYQLRNMGFAALMPVVAVTSAVGALALAGIPPLGAGWTKEQIVGAAGSHGIVLTILVMAAGMLSAAYAARFQLLAFGIVQQDPASTYLPLPVERAMPALLAIGSLLLGALWLDGVHGKLIEHFGGMLPVARGWEILLSLAFVVVGLIIGDAAARRRDLGTGGRSAHLADWLGLPRLIEALVIVPVCEFSKLAAAADDRVVDAGVAATARLGRFFASISAETGEAATDAIPVYAAKMVGAGARQTLRLQTGMTHHYYVLIAGGVVGVVALLLVGL